MSGAEAAALVLGLISASISIIDAAKKLYDAAHDAAGLPQAFREVAVRTPLVLEILRKAEGQLKTGKVKENTCQAVRPVMEQCKLKAEKLSAVFKEVLPGENASRLERYQKAVRSLEKGSRVEELMMGILTDIQLLAENRSMGAATEEQFEQLLVAMEEIKKLDPSLPEESSSVNVSHTGSGHNLVATGSAIQPVNFGSGPLNSWTSAGGAFNAPTYNAGVNQYYDQEAFTFYQPNMMAERIENLYISSDTTDQPSRVYNIAPARNENFVLRDILNQKLMKLLPLDKSDSVAIWGLGGCGKTQIALNYAYQRYDATNCSVFWIRGDSEDVFAGSYGDVAQEVNLPKTLTGDDKLRAVQKWIESQSNWLVIIDNADDLDDSRSWYLKYVPRPHARSNDAVGAIVWTTRDGGILDLPYGISGGIDASVMQSSDSLLLFRRLLHRTAPRSLEEDTQPASVDEQALLDELGDLPLAISQAAAYIRKHGNIRKYVNRLRNSESEAWKLLLRDQKDPYRHARQNSVMKTWIVSITRLQEENDVGGNALQILRTAAFLDNHGITLALLQYSVGMEVDQDDLQDAIARLVEYSFLQYQEDIQEGSRIYSQHKLFSMAMRHHLNREGSRSTYASHAFSTVLHCFPGEDHGPADRCSLYLPHALRVLSETGCSDFEELADQLLRCMVFSYTFHGRYQEANTAIRQRIALQDQLPANSEIQKLDAQGALGWILILQGECHEAEEILTSTLDTLKRILGEDHPSIWMTTTSLARAVSINGEHKRAEDLQLAILAYHKRQSRPDLHDILGALNDLALTYRHQRRFTEADKMLKHILAELKKADPGTPVLALHTQNNLAIVLRDQGALVEAEKLSQRTVEECKAWQGDSHPDTIYSMATLFHIYISQGRFGDAEEVGLRVKHLSQTVLGARNPVSLSVSRKLRELQRDPGFLRIQSSQAG